MQSARRFSAPAGLPLNAGADRGNLGGVTAQEIIEEIKRLDPKEQLGVIRFAYELDAERQLSGKELSKLPPA